MYVSFFGPFSFLSVAFVRFTKHVPYDRQSVGVDHFPIISPFACSSVVVYSHLMGIRGAYDKFTDFYCMGI